LIVFVVSLVAALPLIAAAIEANASIRLKNRQVAGLDKSHHEHSVQRRGCS